MPERPEIRKWNTIPPAKLNCFRIRWTGLFARYSMCQKTTITAIWSILWLNPITLRTGCSLWKISWRFLRMQKVNNYILEDKTLQVTVIRMDGKIYGTNIYRSDLIDQMSQTQWYQQLMKNPWLILWVQDSFLSELIHDTENDHLFNIWTLKDPETFEPIAFLIVDFRLKDLTEQFSAQFDERETLVVTDTYHNTILCGGSLSQEKATQMISQEESGQQVQSEYYCISTVPKSCNWTISLITDKTVAAGRYDSFSTLISIIF